MDTKLGLPPMAILFHQQIVSQRKGSSHLGVLRRLTFFPPGLKAPCQPLLVFLNGLVDYKCCQPTIVCSAILSAFVCLFVCLFVFFFFNFCIFSILLVGLVLLICLNYVFPLCQQCVCFFFFFFMYCTILMYYV